MDLKSKLPKSFGVRQNTRHPRWKECINTMNIIFNGDLTGRGWKHWGVDIDGSYEPWDSIEYFDVIISVDEFFQMIVSPTEINNYEIF